MLVYTCLPWLNYCNIKFCQKVLESTLIFLRYKIHYKHCRKRCKIVYSFSLLPLPCSHAKRKLLSTWHEWVWQFLFICHKGITIVMDRLVNGGKNIQTNKEKICSICDLIPEVLIKSNCRNKFVLLWLYIFRERENINL